jgi:predicted metal-binding membrane protein
MEYFRDLKNRVRVYPLHCVSSLWCFQPIEPVASPNFCLIAGIHLAAATRIRHVDTEMKSFLTWMFVWAGIPLLFSGASWLTYYLLRNERLSDHKADWICLGIMFALVLAGILLVRDCLRPRAAWVAPVYGGVMLVSLFTVLALISLQFEGDL